ncbi:MAG: DUF2247 family protein [Nocardia sp.]|nr:DUF2247 family protein [Nocardia sp.]
MSDKLVQFHITAPFVGARAKLTPDELGYGYENDWLTDESVVRLAIDDVVPDTRSVKTVESLSLLLSDEYDRVPELIEQLRSDPRAVWVYLALAWVYENADDFEGGLWQTVEMLYADFDYPTEMEPFVPFMPPPCVLPTVA